MRSFMALLRRELWEHRLLPCLLPFLLLFGFLVNLLDSINPIPIDNVNEMASNSAGTGHAAGSYESIRLDLSSIGGELYVIMLILVLIYALDALFKERKDKSILFWKSLPVTDTAIVLSKLVTAVVTIPLIVYVTVVALQVLTWLMLGLSVGDTPYALAPLWEYLNLPHFWIGFFFQEVKLMLWLFPLVGWLLLCSAWAGKSPATWAFMLPLLLVFIDSAFRLHTGLDKLLFDRLFIGVFFPGSAGTAGRDEVEDLEDFMRVIDSLMTSELDNLMHYLSRPDVLGGLVVGGIFIALAILIRRRRGDESNALLPIGA